MADAFLKEFDVRRGPAGIHTIRADFLRCQLMSRSLPNEDEERKMELEREKERERERRGEMHFHLPFITRSTCR